METAHLNEGVACVTAETVSILEERSRVLSQRALEAAPKADAARFWGTRVDANDGLDLQAINAVMRSRAELPGDLQYQAEEAQESAGSTHNGDGAR